MFDELYKEKITFSNDFYNINNRIHNMSLLFLLCIIFIISEFIIYYKNVYSIIFIVILIISVLIIINYKLKTNKKFSNIKRNLQDVLPELNTGDFILYRNYVIDNIFILVASRIISPLISDTYFTHIGMVYKKNDNIYIIENNYYPKKSLLTNQIKTGPTLIDLNMFMNDIDNTRIHIVKNNIHEYININKLNMSLDKYKNYLYYEDGLYCFNYISKLLEENGLLNKLNKIFIVPNDLLNAKNYKFNIKFEKPIFINDI
jgi:hypothetical protein